MGRTWRKENSREHLTSGTTNRKPVSALKESKEGGKYRRLGEEYMANI